MPKTICIPGMNLLEIIFLSIALAMDCFTVSIVSGVIMQRWMSRVFVRIAILFGLFQALMPLLGWLGTNYFSEAIRDFDHWIAFGLLAFLGGKMIWESFSPEEEQHFDPTALHTQLTLSVATSIDALAVGISFSCLGYQDFSSMLFPLVAIGIGSFLFSILGSVLGVRLGKSIARRLRPELLGGLILLFIGFRILITHLMAE